jgi:hypothetical protein
MRHLASAALGLLAFTAPLAGQDTSATVADSTTTIPRWYAGVAADVGLPAGDLKQNVANAGGLQAHLLLRLDRRGHTALRLQAGWLNHGRESEQDCLGGPNGCRIAVKLSTTNNIFSLGLGPEFSVPVGSFRLNAHGLVGVSRFATLSALGGGLMPDIVAADENFGDTGFLWSGGVGIQKVFYKRTALDIGIAYQGHGRREYLTRGGITDNPDGSLGFDIKRSSANLVAFRIGFSTALGWGTRGSTP